jgi:type III restriction enzyme
VANEPWYVYNANYGTSEEKSFVSMFSRRFESLGKKYKDIYLIRNEREVKIIDKSGRAFEPDFILFCKQKSNKELTYQVFIEPKGEHLKIYDNWKNDFLKEIGNTKSSIKIHTDEYLITAVPFYSSNSENEFIRVFNESLEI